MSILKYCLTRTTPTSLKCMLQQYFSDLEWLGLLNKCILCLGIHITGSIALLNVKVMRTTPTSLKCMIQQYFSDLEWLGLLMKCILCLGIQITGSTCAVVTWSSVLLWLGLPILSTLSTTQTNLILWFYYLWLHITTQHFRDLDYTP
jgi:hypothetical protein